MSRTFIARVALTTATALAGVALAADTAAPGQGVGRGQGWTGVTHPQEVIVARQELMEHIEILMEPIDTIQVKGVRDADKLRASAEEISAMLLAVPHLFPPTTDLYNAKAEQPVTLALPLIWRTFGNFHKLAGAAATAAHEMSEARGKEKLLAASLKLRASCDACHTLYLRAYEPPKFKDSDYQFDFESALKKK